MNWHPYPLTQAVLAAIDEPRNYLRALRCDLLDRERMEQHRIPTIFEFEGWRRTER